MLLFQIFYIPLHYATTAQASMLKLTLFGANTHGFSADIITTEELLSSQATTLYRCTQNWSCCLNTLLPSIKDIQYSVFT